MPDELPKGWVKTTLGEIVEPSRERVLPAEVPRMRYVGLEHIEPQTMKLFGHGSAGAVRSSSFRFSKGDVLYARMRPYLNKVWVAEFDGVCSPEFFVLQESRALNSQFLGARLNAGDFVTYANGQVSGERPRVDFEKLSGFAILLPPLAEQERIVAKLSAALSAVQRAETASRRARERVQRYREAVLHAAVAGELTSQWRKDNVSAETGSQLLRRLLGERRARWEEVEAQRIREKGIEPEISKERRGRYSAPTALDGGELEGLLHDWQWATLDQIGQEGRPIIYGIIKPGPHDPNGVPYVRVTEMKDGWIDIPNLRRASPTRAARFARATLQAGDILISKDGTIGRVAVVPPELAGGNITQHVVRASIHEMISRDYVVFAIRSDWCQRWLTGETRGVALQGVNVADFRRLPIPLPPLAEQIEIVHQVTHRFAAADQLAATLDHQLESSQAMRQRLLLEAFSGHFVDQSPEDEPASVLLERIRVAREAEYQKSRHKRMSKPKSEVKAGGRRSLLAVLKANGAPMTPEELFRSSGHSQESVDEFFAELRELTAPPTRIVEERKTGARRLLRALQ